jgi:type 1 fimbriae regulatory protein FimB
MSHSLSRKYLTHHEVKQLLVAARGGNDSLRNTCLIQMCFLHGCRVSELSCLRLSDVDMSGNTLYVNRLKNGLSTIHPLQGCEKKSLVAWLTQRSDYEKESSDEWLFLSRRGNRLSRQRIYSLIRNLSLRAGLQINAHPHMLRHACGFALADQGADTRLIQDYLGHRNIQHTVLYTAANNSRFKTLWKYRMEGDVLEKM